MENEENHDLASKSVEVATTVIIHAGNARTLVNEALNLAAEFKIDGAWEKIKQARSEIRKAHKTQTEVIQAEARGETMDITLLLTHAQDTMLVASSEVQMAKHMIKMYERLKEIANK